MNEIKNTYKIVDLVSQAWFDRAFIYQNPNLQALFMEKNPSLRVWNAVWKVIIFHVSVLRFQVITIALHLAHIYDYKPIT